MRARIITIALLMAVIGCKKDDNPAGPFYQDISFNIDVNTAPPGFKDGHAVECKPYDPDYLEVNMNNVLYFLDVFRLDGQLHSQNIRMLLDPGQDSVDITISKFSLWNSGKIPETDLPGVDDTVVMMTPGKISDYAEYVANPLDYTVTIALVDRFEIDFEVLCIDPGGKQAAAFIKDTENNIIRSDARKPD